MALKEVKVRIPDLEQGMYVSRLDRPWLETPFLLQGFHIEAQEDVNKLLEHCEYVFVDTELSKEVEVIPDRIYEQKLVEDEIKLSLTNTKPEHYKNKSEFHDELKTVSSSHKELVSVVADVMNDIANNKNVHLPSLERSINPMVESVIRNPDAYSWLAMMKTKDDYTYNHSVSTSVWAVTFGRHLGLPKKDLKSLAMGALFCDVGKMKLPDKLIKNPNRYNPTEFKIIKEHVEHSAEIVRSIEGVNKDIEDMVCAHHERHNGKGYPNGLSGNDISIFGKIAGIVDCYDALISTRAFVSAMSPYDAVKKLYEWRDVDFQSELVEQFIQVVGIYPVGTVVELSDGRVGVIIAHHRSWRLKPKVMMLLNPEKELYSKFVIHDLYKDEIGLDDKPLKLIRNIDPTKYGIDLQELYL